MSKISSCRGDSSGSSTTNSNDNDYFDDDTYDETIATYLAQCDPLALTVTDDHNILLLQPPKTNEGRGKLGVSLTPTIWLANLSCNFKSACKCCEYDANTKNETLNDNEKDTFFSRKNKANSPSSSSCPPTTLLPCVPREFISKEHQRFDALQKTYHRALQRFKDAMEGEGGKKSILQSTRYQLSPRLIIHDPRERSRMKQNLISYLEGRAREMEGRLMQDLEQEEEKTRKVKEKKEWKRQWLRLQKKEDKQTKIEEKVAVQVVTAVQSKNKKKTKPKKKQPITAIDTLDDSKREILDNYPSSSVYAWCCDYCNIDFFPTFDEAAQHELLCQKKLKEINLEVEEEEESESDDGEGEIIGRILKNQSDRPPPSADRILTSTNGVATGTRAEESHILDIDHTPVDVTTRAAPTAEEKRSHPVIDVGDGVNKSEIGTQPVNNIAMVAPQLVNATNSVILSHNNGTMTSERIEIATSPVLAFEKKTTGESDCKVCDLPKENERPGNDNIPMKVSPPTCYPVDATISAPFSEIAQDFMTISVIDYDNRVDDTALPVPCVAREPEEPITRAISSDNATETIGPAKDDDSSSLLHLSSVIYQNKILTTQNDFLTRQNQSLLSTSEELQCQLAAVKRQTFEAIQQVQLKAYIAETSLHATKDHAIVVENLLVKIILDVAADKLEEREIRETIAAYSSMMMSQKNHESARRSTSSFSTDLQRSGGPSNRSPFSRPSSVNDHDNNSGSDTNCPTASRDFWRWMLGNKTDVGVSSSTATAFISDYDGALSRLRRGGQL
jgi:hypothetical protein